MKRSTYEKKLNKVKEIIMNYVITTDADIYNTG